MSEKPQPFEMWRDSDETGMSGTGHVADGVEMPDGRCIMWWLVPPWTATFYGSMADLVRLHGHRDRQPVRIVRPPVTGRSD